MLGSALQAASVSVAAASAAPAASTYGVHGVEEFGVLRAALTGEWVEEDVLAFVVSVEETEHVVEEGADDGGAGSVIRCDAADEAVRPTQGVAKHVVWDEHVRRVDGLACLGHGATSDWCDAGAHCR